MATKRKSTSAKRARKVSVDAARLGDLEAQAAAIANVQSVIELDPEGRVTAANDQFLRMTGYALEEVRGQHHSAFVDPAERDGGEYRQLWEKLARGESVVAQMSRRTKDRRRLWIQATCFCVAGAEGKPRKYVEIAFDLSALHDRLEETSAELQVRKDIMNVTSIVSEGDRKGDILSINDKYIEVSKYSREELLGSPHSITRHPDMPKEVFKKMWSTIGHGEVFRGVIKNRAKDGQPYYVDAVIAPLLGENGKPKKYLGVRYEITATEIERQNARGILAAISASYAYVEFDLGGHVLAANPKFLQLMGYQSEEVAGKHHRMFVDPGLANSPAYQQFWSELNAGKPCIDVFKRTTKSGQEVWLQATYAPVKDEMGRVLKIIKIATDVTAQVRASEENARIRTALDKASASVMLADDNLSIIYINEAATKLFREAQAEFRRDLPALDAERIVGSNIDVFHKNPAHQRQLLSALRSTHHAEVRLGGRAMRIAATPVLDTSGKRLGTVVEWWDRTQEVRSEQEVSAIVRKALEGDLTERVPTDGKTEFFAILASGLNELLENTAQMVRQIKAAALAVHRGAEEISQGNTNLSQRTEEQSASLEETASSMEQMTSTVKQNADNAGQANQLATAARDQAEKGGAVVGKAVRAMTEINEASKKIADIISVIDEIAFQTNLLALNAAVEAARAGEQGRGFAVVATEVRSLAGRSATAAKEIKDLIQDSVRKVEDGSMLVTQSGQTLEQIVASVKKVSDIVAEIAAASREQSSGIEQVNKAVMQMDEMTQQNAALVEEATAASQSMAEQAGALSEMMERYRLGDSKEPSRDAAQPAARGQEAAGGAKRRERRGTERPWSRKAQQGKGGEESSAPAPAPKAKGKAAAAAGSEGEWQDF